MLFSVGWGNPAPLPLGESGVSSVKGGSERRRGWRFSPTGPARRRAIRIGDDEILTMVRIDDEGILRPTR
jgi:hypothetical protein